VLEEAIMASTACRVLAPTVVLIPALLLAGCNDSATEAAIERSRADMAIAWNERVLTIAEAEDHFLTLKGVRTAAMMHAAMHDALNAVHRRYRHYVYTTDTPRANPVAAAAQAAYEVAVSQYPGKRADFDAELQLWLASIGADRRDLDPGIVLGREVATAVLSQREGDGWNTETGYQLHTIGPGVYAEFPEHSGTPSGFVFGAGWAVAKPFALTSPGQFRSPPPPDIASDAYTAAFDEVKELGRFQSASRTADQTHIALWWKDFAENSHNRLVRELLSTNDIDLWDATRLFALLNMSIMDSYISSFENKFHYNHWRPFTAIRWADNDGNPATAADPDWTNTHRHTYPFPSYPSAHGTACAAAMTVIAETFGERRAFTMTTTAVNEAGPMSPMIPMDPPTRSFDSFSAAAMECALSRVYLGIHFRYDSLEGNRLGKEIGNYALANRLTRAP
jgi:membrane-associated phospholipid phosphatase